MGLSTNEIAFLAAALEAGALPVGGDVLEFGESEAAPEGSGPDLLEILIPFIPAERMAEAEWRMMAAVNSTTNYQRDFGPARALYHAVFEPASYVAVDLDPGPRKYCLDLNRPLSLGRRFDCVINNGTSEHLFDQANFFRIMHRHTKVGGVMIHWTPCLGWVDHGFYNVQPSFFFDLADANGYAVRLIGLASQGRFVPLPAPDALGAVLEANPELGDSMVCAILEKTRDQPFAVPNQGVFPYPEEAVEASRRPHVVLPPPGPNLALNRPALQSSTSEWSWDSDPAVDAAGAVTGVTTGAYGFHTAMEPEPWWQVDLGAVRVLDEAVIYNCLENGDIAARSAHLAVSLSSDGETWRPVYSRADDAPFGGADGHPLRVPFNGETARFVRVSLPEGGWLHLDEIEIYGPGEPIPNAAAGDDGAAMLLREGYAARAASNWPAAVERWAQLRDRYPEFLDGWVHAPAALIALGREAEAQHLLVEARRRFPDEPGPLKALAYDSLRREDWREARDRWADVLRQFPDDEESLHHHNDAVSRMQNRALGADGTREAGEIVVPDTDLARTRRALMLRFEGLGENCEFGLVQRKFNAEPLGLFRWASMPVDRLSESIEAGLPEFEDPADAFMSVEHSDDEYYLRVPSADFFMHTFISRREDPVPLAESMKRRLSRLREKMLEDMAGGRKIFLRKSADGALDIQAATRLHAALNRYGRCRLVWVCLDDGPRVGKVDQVADDILVGYIDRYWNGWDGQLISYDLWLSVCGRAAEVFDAELVVA